ncbi:hypothetical protein H257_03765 [Aphanomyces astaci]|uniref:Uncharacterized protein n=1 Tax=Aphanomyces astaci TaxID=112090 RepID=W4H022_APHAT|nr:hypothetical protein H257_03765 [Aphanomyces astaci]ETV84599.1 hypothetical protein H257_03765 [Aphanomyces astaci]|eukprot:XP_009826291.1 hypothetical protein H257_03765 [Aphanomyces astaci]
MVQAPQTPTATEAQHRMQISFAADAFVAWRGVGRGVAGGAWRGVGRGVAEAEAGFFAEIGGTTMVTPGKRVWASNARLSSYTSVALLLSSPSGLDRNASRWDNARLDDDRRWLWSRLRCGFGQTLSHSAEGAGFSALRCTRVTWQPWHTCMETTSPGADSTSWCRVHFEHMAAWHTWQKCARRKRWKDLLHVWHARGNVAVKFNDDDEGGGIDVA